ncbi:hypothetical protein IWX49DRAFT_554604 [Phyllosticta citricarpa]|uniref:Uncharacterized protein n=1 Tax=Phyllosticta citricarpa TaxID=55181 RepID=A0ABR1M6H8_9PEZI
MALPGTMTSVLNPWEDWEEGFEEWHLAGEELIDLCPRGELAFRIERLSWQQELRDRVDRKEEESESSSTTSAIATTHQNSSTQNGEKSQTAKGQLDMLTAQQVSQASKAETPTGIPLPTDAKSEKSIPDHNKREMSCDKPHQHINYHPHFGEFELPLHNKTCSGPGLAKVVALGCNNEHGFQFFHGPLLTLKLVSLPAETLRRSAAD